MIELSVFEKSYFKLVSAFASEEFKADLQAAQKEFFDNAGTLDDTKPNYTLRMNQFYDWYFLTRLLAGYMQTPLAVVHMQRSVRLEPEDLETIEILNKHQHSLYECIKLKNNEMIVRDLLTGKKETVSVENFIFSFDEKEYFEARIVELNGKKFFLKGFCFHPESAQKYILEQVKVFQKNPDLNFKEFFVRLNKMRYKFEQYRHVKPELIYTNENKLGL